jgi:hypothetical protein
VFCEVVLRVNDFAPVVLKFEVPALELRVGEVGLLDISFNQPFFNELLCLLLLFLVCLRV